MNRKETTRFLSELLEAKIRKKIWSKEISFNVGTKNVIRVDYMTFEPLEQINVSGIEKGIFSCYEIKSSKEDFHSGFGQNYIGEKNYLVMTMSTYKQIIEEIPPNVGVYVAIPEGKDLYDEFENPTNLSKERNWELKNIRNAHPQGRKKSLNEMLFCMLRSKNTY